MDILDSTQPPSAHALSIRCTTWAETARRIASHLKPRTAAGPDDIPPELIKYAHPSLFDCLALFIADCSAASFFPAEVTDGLLIYILKRAELDDNNESDHCPVKCSSVLGKVVESTIGSDLFPRNSLLLSQLHPSQFAGRKQHSGPTYLSALGYHPLPWQQASFHLVLWHL
jgi:hypothetical protein